MTTMADDHPHEGWLVRSARVIEGGIAANRVPLTVFLVSRLGLVLAVYVALLMFGIATPSPGESPKPQMYADNLLIDGWARWDAFFYRGIAVSGYHAAGSLHNNGVLDTNFFPLYPITMRAVSLLVGDAGLSGLVVSNGAFLIALILLYRLTMQLYDEPVARRTITLLAVTPFSWFFCAIYSESLFTALALAAFYAAVRERWGWAVVFAALVSATRIPGIFVSVGLAVLYFEQRGFDRRRIDRRVLLLPLGVSGAVATMAFFWISFGNPLQFAAGQPTSLARAFNDFQAMLAGLTPQNIAAGTFWPPGPLNGAVLLVALLLAFAAWRLLPYRAFAVWCIVHIAASYSIWWAYSRYTLPLFPLFIAAALLLKKQGRYHTVLFVSTLLSAIFSIVLGTWHWTG